MTTTLGHIQTEQRGEVIIATLLDRKIIDPGLMQELGDELFKLVDEHRSLIIDFGNIQFFFTTMLSKLIILDKKLKSHGCKLRLCNMREEIYEVFALTRLNQLFDIKG